MKILFVFFWNSQLLTWLTPHPSIFNSLCSSSCNSSADVLTSWKLKVLCYVMLVMLMSDFRKYCISQQCTEPPSPHAFFFSYRWRVEAMITLLSLFFWGRIKIIMKLFSLAITQNIKDAFCHHIQHTHIALPSRRILTDEYSAVSHLIFKTYFITVDNRYL